MQLNRVAKIFGASLALVASLAACTQSSPAAKSSPESSRPPTSKTPAAIAELAVLPLNAYRLSVAQEQTFSRAENVLIGQCMKLYEFNFAPPVTAIEKATAFENENLSRVYGISDLDRARKFGFGVDPEFSDTDKSNRQQIPQTENFVLTGEKSTRGLMTTEPTGSPGRANGKDIPPGGCYGEARKKLYGSAKAVANFTLATDLQRAAWQESVDDPQAEKANAQWAACVKKRGYPWTKPDAAAVKYYRKLGSTPDSEEISAAVADVECKTKTRYIPTLVAINVIYEKKAIEENQLALTEEKKQATAALNRAAEIVGQT